MTFSLIDWLIVVVYLALSLAAGFWASRYAKNLSGYLVAGRGVKVALGVATFAATEFGTITFMYFAELGYVSGFACFSIGILAMLAYFVIGKTGFIVKPLRRLEVMTIPEFYEARFSRKVRLLGGILLFLGGVLNMGIFLKFDGIFLSEVMGFGQSALVAIMVFMLIVVLLYTILGGMFSVVITDYLQFVVLSLGLLATTVIVLTKVDIPLLSDVVFKQYGEGGFNPIVNPRYGWTFLLWVFVTNLAAAALWQPGMSKALASESPEAAQKVFVYTSLTFAGRAIVPMFLGVAALALLGPGAPSAAAVPRLLGHIVPSGLLGLIVAGMLAASMSTYSAYLLAWSSVGARDIIGCLRKTELDAHTTIRVTRWFAGCIGVFLFVFGLWYRIPDTAYQYLFITGAMYTAGALSCVAAGLYWKRATTQGAYAALLLGAVGPVGFLALEKFQHSIPAWLGFVTDVNVSGLLSFVLAAAGMIGGSLFSRPGLTSSGPKIFYHA